ncbi:MAG: DUF3048 C-terminal domain-containing protein [Mycobacteriales bacterium]
MPSGRAATKIRGRLILSAAACLPLLLAACSSAAGTDPSAGGVLPSNTTPPPIASATPTAGVAAPLTGVPVAADIAGRSAVAVPVDVNPARPPTGLNSADVVYAEWDGKSTVRLTAIFQSQDNGAVGPVAGLSAADAKLLPVIKPVLAAGPTYAKFYRQAAAAGLNVASASIRTSAFVQSGGAAYASTAALRTLAVRGSTAPPRLFPIAVPGEAFANSGVRPVTSFRVPSASQQVFAWTWDPAQKRYHATVGGTTVSAANVIVMSMGYKTILAKAPQGPAIPTADVFGSGAAYAVSGGKGVSARWARNGPLKVHTFATADGTSLRFAPGPTWVIFEPLGNAWAVG